MSKPKPTKLPRATLEQKIKILDFYHQSDKPQLETVEAFRDQVAISTLTFNEWVKREDEYRKQYQALDGEFQKNSRRKTKFKYEKINRAMDLLVKQRLERGEPVTEPILRDYWQVYAHQFGVDNPKRLCLFSHGWLNHFKKRHGICKLKKIGNDPEEADAAVNSTLNFNKKLLTGAVADPTAASPAAASATTAVSSASNPADMGTKYAPEPVGLFKPQLSLNFALPYPRLLEDSTVSVSETPTNDSGQLSLGLYETQAGNKLGANPFTLADMERFIENVAEPFFIKNQYDYPQTMKLYQDFKNSFLSERLISLRSGQENYIKAQDLQRRSSVAHHHHKNIAIGESEILDRSMAALSQQDLNSGSFSSSDHSPAPHRFNGGVPIELAQQTGNDMTLISQRDENYSRRHNENRDLTRALAVSRQHRHMGHLADHTQKVYEEQALLTQQQELLEQRNREEQLLLQQQVYENHRQPHTQAPHRVQRGQRGPRHLPREAPPRLGIHKLPRLAVAENGTSPVAGRAISSPGLPAALSIAAPFSNSRDERSGLDEIFVRPGTSKTPSYNEERQWTDKSELRRMWEQNKILLS
ncbi:hypothetical protein PUMCH_000640 [Australozyma saopauloensis]|uniref:HTH CENPB-type domain-containing protein n=1 Tax=Australozyma saopauloensis TaxID=291208 RepID=A0AAX4H4E8_9ASCO|nr:hypothetical protein PUMCH_000640 [[Candida] saopauloensis]